MKRIILLVLAFSLMAACAPGAPAVDPTGDWSVVSYGKPADLTAALDQVDTYITFKDGQVTGNVGCNSFGGAYTLKGDTITFDPIMSTMMFCEMTNDQEQGVLAVLQGKVRAAMNGDLLTLTSSNGLVLNLAPR